jgi:hypothetical protein
MPPQKQLNWCWAAVAAFVENVANGNQAATPCQMAHDNMGDHQTVPDATDRTADCCARPAPCDFDGVLDRVLKKNQRLKGAVQSGRPPFSDIKRSIDDEKMPVCVRIEWNAGGAHFVAIIGYSGQPGSEFIDIKDPGIGSNSVPLATFPGQYQHGGVWAHTMFTKK